MEKTSTEKRKLSVIIVIWYYFHKYYFQHAEEGFLLAYFACKNQSVVLHFFCCCWLFLLVFFGCGVFFISFSWNSPFCIHTFYHKPGWAPSIWALTKLLCLKVRFGFLYFSRSVFHLSFFCPWKPLCTLFLYPLRQHLSAPVYTGHCNSSVWSEGQDDLLFKLLAKSVLFRMEFIGVAGQL